MSFGSGSNDTLGKSKPKLLGLDEIRSATSEQARPVPYIAGRQRVAVSFISAAYDVRHEPVTNGEKKGDTTAFNYYATFASLVGIGPVTALHEIWFDDEPVWTAGETASGDYADITIDGRGTARIYWGTETQTQDPTLAASENHPAYRGFCYIVWDQLNFGQGRTDAPNIEVIVSRDIDPPAWFTASPTIGNDANPAAVIWELVTSTRFGLGAPESRLDTDSLATLATDLEDEALGISPVINRTQSLRQLLVEVLGYVDGYHKNQSDGTLAFGLIRPVSDGTGLPVITADDVSNEPRFRPGSWSRATNQAQVKFTNGDRYHKEDVSSADVDATLVITGEFRAPVFDRPWITDPDTAAQVAQVLAQRGSVPRGEGDLTLRKSSVGDLAVGDVFKLHWQQVGVTYLRCRIMAIEWPKAGMPEALVEFEFERGVLNQVFHSLPAIAPPDRTVYAPEAATYQSVIELTPPLALDDQQPNVGFLVARPSGTHDRFWIWREFATDDFATIGTPSPSADWSMRGTVTSSWDGSGRLSVTLSGTDTTLATSGTLFSQTDIDSRRVFVLVGTEALEITAATLVSAGVYALDVVRAQLDTAEQSHTTGDEVWIFHADRLPKFSVTNARGTERFKFQPAIAGRRADISTCDPVSISLTWRSAGPTSPLNLRAFDDLRNPTYTAGQDITLTWTTTTVSGLRIWERFAGVTPDATVRLKFLSVGLSLAATVDLAAGVESYTWTNASLITALGSEVSFYVRVYQVKNGFESANYSQVKVTKV